MVYLPDYRKARSFKLNGEPGWVWVEATGKTNPFGWFPEGQIEGPCLGQEISAELIPLWQPPDEEEPPSVPAVTEGGSNILAMIMVFLIVIAIMGIITLLFRRRRQA